MAHDGGGTQIGREARGLAEARGSVLFVISNLALGGAERQLVYLSTGLRRRGWTVSVACMTPQIHRQFAETLETAGVSLIVLQEGTSARLGPLWRAFRGSWQVIRHMRPSAIVGFMPHAVIFSRILGQLARTPRIVNSLRSTKSTRPWHDRLLALTRLLDDALVANSPAAAAAHVVAGVTTKYRSCVIPNGYELARPFRRAVARTGFTWVHVAMFRPEKGHGTLLHAAAMVAEHAPFKLVLAGGGPQLAAMKSLAVKLKLEKTVSFLGQRTDIANLLHDADAFVLPSDWEGLPNALIEALAAGLPAVASKVGGTSDVVHDGVSGFLVPPNDPQRLANAMLRMMKLPPETRKLMGQAGRKHVLSTFDMELMIDEWEKLLAPQA